MGDAARVERLRVERGGKLVVADLWDSVHRRVPPDVAAVALVVALARALAAATLRRRTF
jgi:hypothetical protein